MSCFHLSILTELVSILSQRTMLRSFLARLDQYLLNVQLSSAVRPATGSAHFSALFKTFSIVPAPRFSMSMRGAVWPLFSLLIDTSIWLHCWAFVFEQRLARCGKSGQGFLSRFSEWQNASSFTQIHTWTFVMGLGGGLFSR